MEKVVKYPVTIKGIAEYSGCVTNREICFWIMDSFALIQQDYSGFCPWAQAVRRTDYQGAFVRNILEFRRITDTDPVWKLALQNEAV